MVDLIYGSGRESFAVSLGDTVLRRTVLQLCLGGFYYLSGTHLTSTSVMGTGEGKIELCFLILNIFPYILLFF